MGPVQPDSLKGFVIKEQMIVEWFKVDKTVSYIALVIGLFIIIIAYFAGGRENKSKLLFAILAPAIIGVLSLPLFIKFGLWIGILGHQLGAIFLMTVFIIFIAALACHVYEIVTVTAKEARPN